MKKIYSYEGTLIPQMIMAVMLTFSVNALSGQKHYGILDDNQCSSMYDYQGPKWKPSTNPYQFLLKLYQAHGQTFRSVTDKCMFIDNSELKKDVQAAFSIPDFGMKGISTIGDILSHALMFHYGNKESQKIDYLKIKYSSNPKDYENYLYRYPTSPYCEIVSEKMQLTTIAKKWETSQLVDRESYYEGYLQANESYSLRYCKKSLEENDKSNLSEYEGFDQIDLCLMTKQVKIRLEELRTQTRKQTDTWLRTCDSNSYSAYNAYHRQYLGSALADSALIRMRPFEEDDYQKAVEINTRVAYEKFLQHYPNGFYSTRVANNIIDLFQAVHHLVPKEISFVAAYETTRPGYAQVGIVNADKHNKTYTITIGEKAGLHTVLHPKETIWLELPAAGYVDVLVEADNREVSFTKLYFNAFGCLLYLYGDSPEWGNFSSLFNTIDSEADQQAVKKLIQEADSICGERIHFNLE